MNLGPFESYPSGRTSILLVIFYEKILALINYNNPILCSKYGKLLTDIHSLLASKSGVAPLNACMVKLQMIMTFMWSVIDP